MRITIPNNANHEDAGKVIADALRKSTFAYPSLIAEIALRVLQGKTINAKSITEDHPFNSAPR